MENRLVDRFVSLIFAGIGSALILQSRTLTHSAYGSSVGPNAFPTLLGAVMLLLSIILLIKTFRYKHILEKTKSLDYKKFAVFVGLMILYVFLFEPLGYVLSTFLLLIIGFQLLERGKIVYSIIIAALFSGIVYYVYVSLLKGTLPPFPEWLVF